MRTDNTLYFGPGHRCYCNDVPIQGVPLHPPHHHNNQVFFLVSPMTLNEWCIEWKVQQNKGEKKYYLLQTLWASNRLHS